LQFSPELPALVDRYGSALAIAGKNHLLVSLPANNIPTTAEKVWAELLRKQFRIIISQPESRPALRRQPETIRSWVEKGIKLQISAASVLGWHGREVRRYAHDYLERYSDRMLIASNGHAGNGDAGALKQAREELTKVFGDRQARQWLRETPAAILGREAISQAAGARTFAQRFSFLRSFTSW
jgi:protein-tyrosine phosphatase